MEIERICFGPISGALDVVEGRLLTANAIMENISKIALDEFIKVSIILIANMTEETLQKVMYLISLEKYGMIFTNYFIVDQKIRYNNLCL